MIERLYPGVYLTEGSFNAKPIEGVATATPHALAAHDAAAVAPQWTDHNQSDPGITLVQAFAWPLEAAQYRAQPHGAHHAMHAAAPWGIAEGLAVASGRRDAVAVSVSPGTAIAADGQPVSADSPRGDHRMRKP